MVAPLSTKDMAQQMILDGVLRLWALRMDESDMQSLAQLERFVADDWDERIRPFMTELFALLRTLPNYE